MNTNLPAPEKRQYAPTFTEVGNINKLNFGCLTATTDLVSATVCHFIGSMSGAKTTGRNKFGLAGITLGCMIAYRDPFGRLVRAEKPQYHVVDPNPPFTKVVLNFNCFDYGATSPIWPEPFLELVT